MSTRIQYLRRDAIDINRWDGCIDTSPNGLIYANADYLDHMSRHWDALVWNDYEAVMPLTWNKKYSIAYLYQPAFTASLGVFGKLVTWEMVRKMLSAIPAKFKLVEIELNPGNMFKLPANSMEDFTFRERTNLILDLSRPYEQISAGYRENLQRNLKKSAAQGLQFVTGIPVDEVLQLSRVQMDHVSNYTKTDFENFRQLFTVLHAKSQALPCGVYTSTGELAASAVFFFSHQRAYYILVGNPTGVRVEGASHFLIDRFIQEQSGKNLLLDFEGSDISGVAQFYTGFGAMPEKYLSVRKNNLPWLVKVLSSKS